VGLLVWVWNEGRGGRGERGKRENKEGTNPLFIPSATRFISWASRSSESIRSFWVWKYSANSAFINISELSFLGVDWEGKYQAHNVPHNSP
jgi:hypothetical protein